MRDFEWDDKKRLINVEKHHIDFIDAVLVFDDPHRIEMESKRQGELRYITVGKVNGFLIFVVYTQRESKKRIISARIASQEERKLYVEMR